MYTREGKEQARRLAEVLHSITCTSFNHRTSAAIYHPRHPLHSPSSCHLCYPKQTIVYRIDCVSLFTPTYYVLSYSL
jgi:hypothetical protein